MHSDVEIPSCAHEGDAGFDLRAYGDTVVGPWERKAIPTGLKVEVPIGYELQVRPRSGVSLNTPLLIANAPGTVDSGYRGELKIIVLNASWEPFLVRHGDRIAQGVVVMLPAVRHTEVTELSLSDRGEKGFGSTGYNKRGG